MSEPAQRITWPLVVLATVAAAFYLGLFMVSDPVGRTALLGMLTTSVGTIVAIIVQRAANKIERIERRMRRGDRDDHRQQDGVGGA